MDSQTIGDADEAPDLMERSTTRPGLRRLRNPVNSHNNRFEREFNYASVKSRSGNKPKWHNAKKVGRSRSGPEKQVKGSKCARGELSQAMNVIFAQIAKNDRHAQVSVNKGIRRHGDKALEALLSEFSQIHNHDTFSLKWRIS